MLKPDYTTNQDIKESYGKFVITPLPSGFGHSMGNAYRRVLLSSIEGAAITHVKINDVVHTFSTIDGVTESALDMIMNLKGLRFKVKGNGPFTMTLSKKGKGKITGADFKGGDVEVINKDLHIAEVTTAKAKLDIELTLDTGFGFSPSEEKGDSTFGTLSVDSVFSPVTKVVYKVEDERVGRKSNYDKLTLEIWTDGTIKPDEALRQSAETLGEFFSYTLSGKDEAGKEKGGAASTEEDAGQVDEKVYEIIIDELDLPTRVINALLREKIETVGDLIERGPDALVDLKGVGRKSITLIEKELEKFGVKLELK